MGQKELNPLSHIPARQFRQVGRFVRRALLMVIFGKPAFHNKTSDE